VERISDRHEGDVGGRLEPFAKARPVAVTVVVATGTAHLAAAQHTAWMLVNLLARAVGIVTVVRVACPQLVPLAGRVIPLAGRDLILRDAFVAGGQAIGAVPVQAADHPRAGDTVIITGGAHPDAAQWPGARYASGQGWWGAVSNQPLAATNPASSLPFGPYAAAALAAAEVYLRARLPADAYSAAETVGWDCWTQALTPSPAPGGPVSLLDLDMSGTALAGAGAVGTVWMHAIWAAPGVRGDVLIADADKAGVTNSNLNRCPLFGTASLGEAKAVEAAHICHDATVTWDPRHARFEDLGTTPGILVSAVDTNRAREALQGRYPPRILSASTRDLRAETLRAGPPGQGACLRCYNPPEPLPADDDLRAQVRAGGDQAVRALAEKVGVSGTAVRHWLDQPGCDEVGDRLLATLRRDVTEPPPRFAAGFTSVMAGTMLAAETIKLLLGQPVSPHLPAANNVTFQFLKPAAASNAARMLARDPGCPACRPTGTATRSWQQRYERATFPAGAIMTAMPGSGLRSGNRQATLRRGRGTWPAQVAPGSLPERGQLRSPQNAAGSAMMAA
jgi:molybdopterin/thiamine biosynthesis adenylyltransferase